MSRPLRFARAWVLGVLVAAGLAGCGRGHGVEQRSHNRAPTEIKDPATRAQAQGQGQGTTPPAAGGVRHPTRIHRPYTMLGMTTERTDIHGTPARVPCLICHQSVEAKAENRFASQLESFHQYVQIQHGGQSCRTCHEVPGFDSYALADGQSVPYHAVMQLCGQCHAQRKLEYENGAHGGMTGYWDTSRGGRDRNHCLDCHNPHVPRVPQMIPAPRPRYRSGL